MTQTNSDQADWVKTRVKIFSTQRTLDVWHGPGESLWQERARQCWEEQLAGWTVVRRHEWGGRVYRGRFDPEGPEFFFKKLCVRNPRYFHRPRRARSTWRHESRMSEAGFNTQRLVALMEYRRMGLLVASGLLSEAVPDCVKLYDLLNAGQISMSLREKRSLLRALGKEVGRLHGAGFYHGDMHLGNILCQNAGGTVRFFWIDNEKGQRRDPLPFRLRVDDLCQMIKYKKLLSDTDLMRLWKAYCGEIRLEESEARSVVRTVLDKSQRLWNRRGWV